jgi:hypothetical protein
MPQGQQADRRVQLEPRTMGGVDGVGEGVERLDCRVSGA